MPDPSPPTWQSLARCRGADPNVFFPGRGRPAGAVRAVIEHFCDRCEVREDCLTWALEHNERTGIWGGTTGRQRRTLRSGHLSAHCAFCGTTFRYLFDSRRRYCSMDCQAAARRQQQRRSKVERMAV